MCKIGRMIVENVADEDKKVFSRDMDDFFVPFGRMVNFQTRKGKFDLLSDVFEDAKERAKEGLDRFLSKLKCRIIISNFRIIFSFSSKGRY